MNQQIIVEAFDAISDGFSVDRVVADPAMNKSYLAACAERGLTESAAQLNRQVMNLRKAGALSGRPRSKRTHFSDEDDYRFAAEMAIRFMERKHDVSLDRVICDPALASEFDSLAVSVCPGYSVLQYRWAALGLRKAKNLEPELAARILKPEIVMQIRIAELTVNSIPQDQGLYLFFDTNTVLYVGESENLRTRLKKHLDHSDNKGLARWMWEYGVETLHVELQILPADVKPKVRRALELELIRSRKPVFNVQR